MQSSFRRSVCQPVVLSLVTSLVLTRLDYGSGTLNDITKRLMDRLQSVLNAAARLVHNCRKYDRISSLLRDLHWLRVPERIKFRLAVLVFRCRNPRLHRTTWRETYSGQTRTTRGDDCDRRRLRGDDDDDDDACDASHTTTNDLRPRLRRCCTARLERYACRHRFCTVTGHFQAALEDSSVWTIIRRTTDLVTCS